MPYISQEIIDRLIGLNVEDVARSLGLSVIKHETRCFMHNDKKPSLKFHPKGHMWKCFVCDIGGNAINLVMRYLKTDFVTACLWLCNQYGIYIHNTPKPKRVAPPLRKYDRSDQTESTFNQEIGSWIISNASLSAEAQHFLFEERKLSFEVINSNNIKSISDSVKLVKALCSMFTPTELVEAGYIKISNNNCYLRIFTPCIIFPYFDSMGKLIGIQTRYIGNVTEAPRFQFISGFKPNIYNQQILNYLDDKEDLYISEGVSDCLALLSTGHKAIAIPSASNLPLKDVCKLIKYNLIMCADHDLAGERAYETLRYHVVRMGGKIHRLEYPKNFKDYGEYYKSTK